MKKIVRMTKGMCMVVLFLFGYLGLSLSECRADGPELKQEIKELRERLRILEDKLAHRYTEAIEAQQPVLTLLKDVKLSGNISALVNYNFNEPDSQTNSLRVFDTEANTFQLGLLELVLEKEPQEGGAGFRIDLNYGDVAESTGSAGLGSTTDEFDLQQAYISLREPLGIDNFNLTIGKFVTLLGYEVIESWANYNTSRSFLFGYAIPFTHTGILSNYVLNEKLDFCLGVVNGWDNFDDNNDAKTVLGRIGINPTDRLSLGITGIYGAEQTADNGSQRGVVDLVATFQATDRLTLGLNYDYGQEEDGVSVDQNASWWGIAGYVQYKLSDRWGLAARAEFFDDDDGVRTGSLQDLWELTFTNEYKLYDNMLVRLEYRHDGASNSNAFTKKNKTIDTQDTILAELVYSF